MNDTKQCHYIDARDAIFECQWVAHCMLKCPSCMTKQQMIQDAKNEVIKQHFKNKQEVTNG